MNDGFQYDDALRPTGLDLHPTSWIAPGSVVVGDVSLGSEASVWYGCVLRGDLEPIRVGARTNIQDLTVVHVDHGLAAEIGDEVTIGHRCIIHGCKIGDGALIGMGAVILSGATIGAGAVVAAGAVVREGFEVPEGTLAAGVPARLKGPVTDSMRDRARDGVETYIRSTAGYREGRLGGGPHGGETGPEKGDQG